MSIFRFGSAKPREMGPLSDSMLDLQGTFRGQRDSLGLPLIEMACVWCGRGAGVEALDGRVPYGWYSHCDPREITPPPAPRTATVEEWECASAAGYTNMGWDTYRASVEMSHLIISNSTGDGVLCPDCGTAATKALSEAYSARISAGRGN